MEYGHGGDIYTYEGMLDFSVNINPFGPPQRVLEAAMDAVSRSGTYPDSRCRRLKAALSKRFGLPDSWFLAGNGAADLIFSAVFAVRPKRALIVLPAFSEYERALEAAGCEIVYETLRTEKNFRLEETFPERITEDLDMVFLCSPSNPAGQAVSRDLLIRIAGRCEEKKVRFVLDECFSDFLGDPLEVSMAGMAGTFPHLFVIRAFTKMHGIPGLRIGYGITSDPEMAEQIESVRQPWSVSVPAEEAAIAALSETGYEGRTRELVRRERIRLQAGLKNSGMYVIPSEANFILFWSPRELADELRKRNILIRDCGNYRGLKPMEPMQGGGGWYRAAVRLPEENDRLLAELLQIVSGK